MHFPFNHTVTGADMPFTLSLAMHWRRRMELFFVAEWCGWRDGFVVWIDSFAVVDFCFYWLCSYVCGDERVWFRLICEFSISGLFRLAGSAVSTEEQTKFPVNIIDGVTRVLSHYICSCRFRFGQAKTFMRHLLSSVRSSGVTHFLLELKQTRVEHGQTFSPSIFSIWTSFELFGSTEKFFY